MIFDILSEWGTVEHVAQPKEAADTQCQLSCQVEMATPGLQNFLIFHETLSYSQDQYCVEQTVLPRARFNSKTDGWCTYVIHLTHTIEMGYFVQYNKTRMARKK